MNDSCKLSHWHEKPEPNAFVLYILPALCLPFQHTVGGGFDSTQSAAGGVPAEKKAEGIIPMVIKQVLSSTNEEGLQLKGMRFASVVLNAIVRSSEYTSTKVTYQLEDHTGKISAHFWLEENDQLSAQPQIAINTYARVYGSVRSSDGHRTIMIFRIEPVQSVNAYTNHLLEVLYARYRAEDVGRGAGDGFGGRGDGAKDFNFNAAGGSLATGSLDAKHQLVYDAIKGHGSDQGISRPELNQKFAHMRKEELA